MRLLITGICGFVGSTLALELRRHQENLEILGLDNFSRPGSEVNRLLLRRARIKVQHGDLRCAEDLEGIPQCDWVLDAAANPSVLAGIDGRASSRQLLQHNLSSTINLLEYCKRHRAGFILLSTSRVYSISGLAQLQVEERDHAYQPVSSQAFPPGITLRGVSEEYSTSPPVSLYGSSKVASEQLAIEYGIAFDFPVWINRCGVMAGAGQFGQPEQGIFSYWINAWLRRQQLSYIGFNGRGSQVRDCFHPRDLVPLLLKQLAMATSADKLCNVGGGVNNSISLAQLSAWCAERFGPRDLSADSRPRTYDIPWLVLDASRASKAWGWHATTPITEILNEIATHAGQHPDWLELSAP